MAIAGVQGGLEKGSISGNWLEDNALWVVIKENGQY